MSTEILSPIEQPSLLYPALYGVRPRRKDYKCRRCGTGNQSWLRAQTNYIQAETLENVFFDFTCGYCGNNFFTAGKIIMNDILEDQINRVYDFTHETGKEFGALIMKRDDGDIVLDMIVIGKDREVEMTPTHELRPKEMILGTFHVHPVTDYPSLYDVGSFLRDDWEKISMVAGVNGNFNMMIKLNKTEKVLDVEAFQRENEKCSTKELADKYQFLYYRGKSGNLECLSKIHAKSSSLENLFNRVSGVKTVKTKVKKQKGGE